MISRLVVRAKREQLSARKAVWRLFNDHSPNARALFIFGAQRSGTTLLLACLDQSTEFEVLGEVSRAMTDFRIRPNDEIRDVIRSSRHRLVVLKPLTDSHRARELLDLVPGSSAVWAFRRVEDRANSAVAKFGDHNLQILREFCEGRGFDRWQAQGLTEDTLAFIRRFDYSEMLPETAAAVFWYIRNSLYFSNGLDRLPNVLPLAYEDLVARPKTVMRGLCRYVGATFDERMVRDVHARSVGRRESRISGEVMGFCQPIYDRLYEMQQKRWQELRLDNPEQSPGAHRPATP